MLKQPSIHNAFMIDVRYASTLVEVINQGNVKFIIQTFSGKQTATFQLTQLLSQETKEFLETHPRLEVCLQTLHRATKLQREYTTILTHLLPKVIDIMDLIGKQCVIDWLIEEYW